jgi:MFS family permease
MDIGRFFLGFGGESFKVANYALLPEWFTSSELAFVTAIAALSRFGNVIVNILSPILSTRYSIIVAVMPGNLLCLISVGMVVMLKLVERRVNQQIVDARDRKENIMEYELVSQMSLDEEEDLFSDGKSKLLLKGVPYNERRNNEFENLSEKTASSSDVSSNGDGDIDFESGSSISETRPPVKSFWKVLYQFDRIFWLLVLTCCVVYCCLGPFTNIASSVLLERDYFKENPSNCHLTNIYQCQSDNNPPISTCPAVHDDNYQFPLPSNYSSFAPLHASDIDCTKNEWKFNGCTDLYCERLNSALLKTSYVMSIPLFIFTTTTVVLGKIVDKIGHRLEILMISCLVFFFTHLILAFTNISGIFPLFGQGIGTSLFLTTFWPIFPLLIDKSIYGTAYGLAMCLQNSVYVIMPMILASVYNSSSFHYIPNVEICFMLTSILGIIPILCIYCMKSSYKLTL